MFEEGTKYAIDRDNCYCKQGSISEMPDMDKFLEWLKKHKKHRALTDKSYKKVYQNKYGKPLANNKVNTELATYGDAVLKLALCKILWKNDISGLTKQKESYETDEILVTIIAKQYDILKYLRFDKNDDKIPQNYVYENEKHKYIATAIEACLGAMYMDKTISWEDLLAIVKEWKKLIDNSKKGIPQKN